MCVCVCVCTTHMMEAFCCMCVLMYYILGCMCTTYCTLYYFVSFHFLPSTRLSLVLSFPPRLPRTYLLPVTYLLPSFHLHASRLLPTFFFPSLSSPLPSSLFSPFLPLPLSLSLSLRDWETTQRRSPPPVSPHHPPAISTHRRLWQQGCARVQGRRSSRV